MNCYLHNDRAAVATCTGRCGRGLCPECTNYYAQPLCHNCMRQAQDAMIQAKYDQIGEVERRLKINLFILGCAALSVLLKMAGTALWIGAQHSLVTVTDVLSALFGLPLIIWGFFAFRWVTDKFVETTGLMFFSTLQSCCIVYFVGWLLVSMTWFFTIPFLLVTEYQELRRLQAELAQLVPPDPEPQTVEEPDWGDTGW